MIQLEEEEGVEFTITESHQCLALKILQAIYIGSECLVLKVDLGDWRSSGTAKNKLCFSPQTLSLTGRQV